MPQIFKFSTRIMAEKCPKSKPCPFLFYKAVQEALTIAKKFRNSLKKVHCLSTLSHSECKNLTRIETVFLGIITMWVTPDGHWSLVTTSLVTSDHQECPT